MLSEVESYLENIRDSFCFFEEARQEKGATKLITHYTEIPHKGSVTDEAVTSTFDSHQSQSKTLN